MIWFREKRCSGDSVYEEETTDLTQKIIDYYNSLKHQNSE